MTIGERIRQVRGKTPRSIFAKHIEITESTLRNYENNLSLPNSDIVAKICHVFNVEPGWLILGGKNNSTEELPAKAPTTTGVELKLIPLVEARLSAGQGSLEVDGNSERSYAFRMDFLLRKGNPNAMVLMRVAGDSMQPEIMDNDVVLIDQSKKDIIPGKIFAVGFDDAIYLKRIDKQPGEVILKSVNEEAYPPIRLDMRGDMAEFFRVIGKVIWSGREYR